MASAAGAAEPGHPPAGAVTVRPIDCVACGGPKHSQRGFCCEFCMTQVQRDRWKRADRARRLRRTIASSGPRSSPVAAQEHRSETDGEVASCR